MFIYTAFNPEGKPIVHCPVDTMQGECFEDGAVECICLMYKGYYLGRLQGITVRHLSKGDTLSLKLDGGGYTMLAQMGHVLRYRDQRVSDLFNMIFQIGVHLGGQETRKPVHHFRPQTLPPKQTVSNEKQQSIRRWNPGRLVQRLSWPKWFLK